MHGFFSVFLILEISLDLGSFFKAKSPGEPGDLLCGWVSKYREFYFPSQY